MAKAWILVVAAVGISGAGCFPPIPAQVDADVDVDSGEIDAAIADTAQVDSAIADSVEPGDTGSDEDTAIADTMIADTMIADTVVADTAQVDTVVDDASADDTVQDTLEGDTGGVHTCPGGCPASTTPCKRSQCDTSSGSCVEVDATDGTPCDDGLVCTISDRCLGGLCLSAQNPCDDGKDCTADGCDEELGGCVHDGQGCECGPGVPCDDGNPCNGEETCDLSTYTCAQGTPLAENVPCDDGLACTDDDRCRGQECKGLTRDCGDELPCSVDSCSEEQGGCVWDTSACVCTDASGCPNDTNLCDGKIYCDTDVNSCEPGTPVTCDPLDDACKRSSCVPLTGECAILDRDNGTECDDDDVCTTTDTCQSGVCTGFAPVTCTPSNTCQEPVGCDPTLGCLETPKEDGTPCQTTADEEGSCHSGTCKRLPIVVAADHYTCLILSDGSLKCWGRDMAGRLGDGGEQTSVPVKDQPSRLDNTVAVAAEGNNTCAVTSDGLTRCWGENPIGNLGYGDLLDRGATPDTVPSLLPGVPTGAFATALSVREGHVCIRTASKTVRCWGWGNGYPGIDFIGGPDTPTTASVGDIDVDDTSPIASVVVAGGCTCALTEAGAVRCWGYAGCNAASVAATLGDDETPSSSPAILPATLINAIAGAGYPAHFCAVSLAGDIYCWGSNTSHQLGVSTDTDTHRTPIPITSEVSFRDVAAGEGITCGITDSDHVRCWGANDRGQCGVGSTAPVTSIPTADIELGGPVAHVSCGTDHCCAVRWDGTAECWGGNDEAQLGLSWKHPITGETVLRIGNDVGDQPGEMPPSPIELE